MSKYFFVILIFILILVCQAVLAFGDGLILRYDFSEGSGDILHDKSGSGIDGTVNGVVEWIKDSSGSALRFNGVNTFIDCGTSSNFGTNDKGTIEMWCKMEAYQGGFFSRSASGAWEDERLVLCMETYGGGQDFMYCISDGSTYGPRQMKPSPDLNKWVHLVMSFDQDVMAIYLNGKRIVLDSKGIAPEVKGLPLKIGFCEGLGISYFKGLMDDVNVYDRMLTSSEIMTHFKQRAAVKGLDLSWIGKVGVFVLPLPNLRKISVEVDPFPLVPIPEGASVQVNLVSAKGKIIVKKNVLMTADAMPLMVEFDAVKLLPGSCSIKVMPLDINGTPLAKTTTKNFTWKKPSPGFEIGHSIKILNNFVCELLNKKSLSLKPYQEYIFNNPFEGWVFFSTTAKINGGDKLLLSIDSASETQRIIVHDGSKDTFETMRYLSMGKHILKVKAEGRPTLSSLVVRSIPELIYCQYPASPHVSLYGDYDWIFINRYLAKNINTMISTDGILTSETENLKKWKEMGKRWIFDVVVPGTIDKTSTLENAAQYWHDKDGYQNPYVSGIIIDEFGGASDEPMYDILTDAVNRIYSDSKLKDKVFYPYTGPGMFDAEKTRKFGIAVMKHGGRLADKYYFPEAPNEKMAKAAISVMRQEAIGWEKVRPGAIRHIIPALGYMSQPNESCNIYPTVDFKVFMDLEMNLLANDPVFFGLYGVLHYLSPYTDEETVRWAGRLYRHYCIEGKKNMLSDELGYTYQLNYVENPDFKDGTQNWTINPAEADSINNGEQKGLSFLEGRYPSTRIGNTYLLTRRSAKGPNIFSQVIKNLKPGQFYSMKMFSCDRQDLLNGVSRKALNDVKITIDGVEMLQEKCFDQLIDNCYSHWWGKFDDKNKYWMNYHWRVFRAKDKTAKLTVSDWADVTKPDSMVGQELMFNFVELQPYFLE